MDAMQRLSLEEALDLGRDACLGAGASLAMAMSLAKATVAAEVNGRTSVGFSHLLDYLASLTEGRIDGTAEPEISFPAAGLIRVDARAGIAQLGFDRSFDDICQRARSLGIVLFALSNSYSTGELGHYVRRIAEENLVALAMSNGPPLMAPPGVKAPVYSTNPLAFAAGLDDGSAIVIDQASSATAFVNIREAAEKGEALPQGWAVDREGRPTQDATEALAGMLLTFGGARGANIALMVEIMAGGLTGANWSIDAPDFRSGNRSPRAGLTIIAVSPALLDQEFRPRLKLQLSRLAERGVYIPGQHTPNRTDLAIRDGLELPGKLVRQLSRYATRSGSS